jgi:hypothetical protein
VSEAAEAEHAMWGEAAFGATWLDWTEVLAIDWDEPAIPGQPTSHATVGIRTAPWS